MKLSAISSQPSAKGRTARRSGGRAYVPPFFGGMYAPPRKGRRHAKLQHVYATRGPRNMNELWRFFAREARSE